MPLPSRRHVWLRWLHIYTPMISLLVALFFALTGITLNHPAWAPGNLEVKRGVTGTLPAGWISAVKVDWLSVAKKLRAQQEPHGRAKKPRVDRNEASIPILGPGYSADIVIDPRTGKYTTNILAQSGVAELNDLHRGRDTGGARNGLINVSGGVLGLVAVTDIASCCT